MVSQPTLIAATLLAALLFEWGVLWFVTRRKLLAEVNARSSHEQPTPTMGGIVIWAIGVTYLLILSAAEPLAVWMALSLGIVGLVGLVDDLRPLSARFRLIVHVFAAIGLVWTVTPEMPVVVSVILLVTIVWFTNLFNFMDGIDGIAASQCLTFCVSAQLLTGGVPGWPGELLWVTAASTLGFLAFNWPPARIFMGDVGSAYLGILIALLVIYLWHTGQLPFVASLILLAGFWIDATYTLCVRIVTRQSFTKAHRSHLYQRLAVKYGHLWTTSAFLGLATFWLLPLAWMSLQFPSWQLLCLGAAVLPLVVLCYAYQAGAQDEPG